MLFSLPTIVAGLVLISANVATAQDDAICQLNCSSNAVDVSGCGSNDSVCQCASSVFVTNFTQCATNTCKSSSADIQGTLQAACPSGFAKATVTTSKDNSAGSVRTGVAAASAGALMFLALLV
ncbi:hypothetical protein B0H17DRAFT_285197 [Mycena rosella]|uniref:CFEM domain-containing protein n=1 Tax=Mycena rosella TaxID=1033263 RepID=A0AAD7G473_MYCRO|nr:hypothetical protein B0H17DRAFT_285197 [Mycena rosella]